jgi:FkbM family methyltransferase
MELETKQEPVGSAGFSTKIHFYPLPGVDGIIDEVMRRDVYGLVELQKSGYQIELAVDVGSFMGFFGVMVRSLWPKAFVICFEPNRDLIPCIRANGNLNVYNAAIRYDGRGDYYVSPKQSQSGAIYDSSVTFSEDIIPNYEHRRVATSRLEDLILPDVNIDLLKLDCEGSEFDILSGMTPGLRWRIRRIVGEYHHIAGYRFIEQIINMRFKHLKPRLINIDPLATIANFEAV